MEPTGATAQCAADTHACRSVAGNGSSTEDVRNCVPMSKATEDPWCCGVVTVPIASGESNKTHNIQSIDQPLHPGEVLDCPQDLVVSTLFSNTSSVARHLLGERGEHALDVSDGGGPSARSVGVSLTRFMIHRG